MSVATTLRRTWPVLLAYAVFSMWGLVCLIVSLMLSRDGGGDVGALIGIIIATIVGHIAGNVLGLARFRLAVVFVMFTISFIAGTLLAATLGPIGVYAFVAMIAALSGYLGIASRLDVVASWFPLSLAVGGAIIWMNAHNAVSTFESGQKYALWDPFTLVCLTGTVFLMLVFLATRNSLGLTAWQDVGRRGGQLGQMPDDASRVAVARPGRGSLLVLFVFTLIVLGATAAVSPYLFRTSDDPDAKDGKSKTEQTDKDGDQKGQGKGKGKGKGHGKTAKKKGHGKGKAGKGKGHGGGGGSGSGSGNGDGSGDDDGEDDDDQSTPEPDTDHASEAAGEALRLGAKILMWLLVAAFVLLVLLMVVFPPIRRALLLRHLERPLWPVAPTARVMNLWRRALATLADVGIEPELGETPRHLARRATSELASALGCEAPGLADAAAIIEKIDYAGRGLAAEDAIAMRAAVTAFIAEVSPRVAFGKRFKRWWAKAPEVEG